MNLYRLSPDYSKEPELKAVQDHFREAFVAADNIRAAALLHPAYRRRNEITAERSERWPVLGPIAARRWVASPDRVIVKYLGPAINGEAYGFIDPPT